MGRKARSHFRVKWIVLTDKTGVAYRHELDDSGHLLLAPTKPIRPIPRLNHPLVAESTAPSFQPMVKLPIPPRIRQKLGVAGSELSPKIWNDFLGNPDPWLAADGPQATFIQ
jgi:hypothetical protein